MRSEVTGRRMEVAGDVRTGGSPYTFGLCSVSFNIL